MAHSSVVKRSIHIGDLKTSVSLEQPFWDAFKMIATERSLTLSDLAVVVRGARSPGNMSSAIRLFILEHFQAKAAASRVLHR